MRHIVVVGLNHRSAPLDLRERLAFDSSLLPTALARLRRELGLKETAILSTCNRVEIYAAVPELDGTVGRLHTFLSQHGRLDCDTLTDCLYHYTEPESIRHLFAVAGGLDSMVLGESEILGQVRQAYDWAKQSGTIGKIFHALFQRALNVGKQVRTQTRIGCGSTSVGALSVELARKIFKDLSCAVTILIGAGEVGELTLKRFIERGVKDVRVMNRSYERAARLAAAYGATPLPLEQLGLQLREVDIVVSSTRAPAYLLSRGEIAAAMPSRSQRPLHLLDLGVPRNLDPEIGNLENVYLFDLDSLQGLIEQSSRGREHALQQSRAIIDRKVSLFLSWWHKELQMPNAECRISIPSEPSLHTSHTMPSARRVSFNE